MTEEGETKEVEIQNSENCQQKQNSCDDFIVQEIDKDGNVVDLVSEELPQGITLTVILFTIRGYG